MKAMKWLFPVVVVALIFTWGAYAMAADAPKTLSGKSSCGGCTGVAPGCCLLLTDKDGGRWVLKGESETVKEAFHGRSAGKTMTGSLAGKAVTKKGKDGKEYKEVKVSKVKIET